MKSLFITTPEDDHVDQLAAHIRPCDHIELLRYRKMPVRDHIALCVRESVYTRVALVDWHVVAMWGVISFNALGGHGSPWCLTTTHISGNEKTFAKLSKLFLKEIIRFCPTLHVHIDAEYKAALRWAKWLGFSLQLTVVNGNDFYLATLKEA